MPRLLFEVPPRLRWMMAVMALLPCVPGLTFLLAGWARDPGRAASPGESRQRAVEQTRRLYEAGSVTLIAGALLGTVVAWKVIRQREENDDEEKEQAR